MKWFLLGIFLSFSAIAMCSSDTIQWGQQESVNQRGRTIAMIGVHNGDRFLMEQLGKDRTLQIHRDSTSTKEIKLEMPVVSGEKLEFHSMVMTANGLLLISTGRLKDPERKVIYATPMSFNGDVLDLPKELDQATLDRTRNKVSFGIVTSPNRQVVMVYRDSPFLKKSNDRLNFRTFDTSLDLLWEKSLKLPYEEEIYELAEYSIDNRGKVYMLSGLGNVVQNSQRIELRSREARSILIIYDPVVNKLKEFDVGLKDKYIMSMSLEFAGNGDPVIAGFYSKDQFNSIGGTFYFRIDGAKKVLKSGGLHPFEEDFLSQFMSSRRAERASELDRFQLQKMHVNDDGSCYLVGEQHYVNERITTDLGNGRQRITYDYIYNDLIAMRLDSAGQQMWQVRIPKQQVSVDDGGPYSSFAFAVEQDTVHIWFNDHPDNAQILSTDPTANLKGFRSFGKSVITHVVVNPEGQKQRIVLGDSKVEDCIFRPK
ncbi:MAG: hypothetical protein HRT74_01310, partial [Flavobacteriales bacterium]|nr:hypothetical protein [Flavobacteriales bacterium]